MSTQTITVNEIGIFENGKLINKKAFAPVTLRPGDDLTIDYKLQLEAPKKTRSEDEYQRIRKELLQLRKAVRDVYQTGHWVLKERYLGHENAAEWPLWTALRDAAGIAPGTATKAMDDKKASMVLKRRRDSDKLLEQVNLLKQAAAVADWARGITLTPGQRFTKANALLDIEYMEKKYQAAVAAEREADFKSGRMV